jgi:hypothetical protein
MTGRCNRLKEGIRRDDRKVQQIEGGNKERSAGVMDIKKERK